MTFFDFRQNLLQLEMSTRTPAQIYRDEHHIFIRHLGSIIQRLPAVPFQVDPEEKNGRGLLLPARSVYTPHRVESYGKTNVRFESALAAYNFFFHTDGYIYMVERSTGKTRSLHNFVFMVLKDRDRTIPFDVIDHINHDREDAHEENLRGASFAQNAQNLTKLTNRDDIGVAPCADKPGRWKTLCDHKSLQFSDKQSAAYAYNLMTIAKLGPGPGTQLNIGFEDGNPPPTFLTSLRSRLDTVTKIGCFEKFIPAWTVDEQRRRQTKEEEKERVKNEEKKEKKTAKLLEKHREAVARNNRTGKLIKNFFFRFVDVNLPEPTKEETVAFEEKMWKQVAEKDPRFEGGWEARAMPSSTQEIEKDEGENEKVEIEGDIDNLEENVEIEGDKEEKDSRTRADLDTEMRIEPSQAKPDGKPDFVGVNYDVR